MAAFRVGGRLLGPQGELVFVNLQNPGTTFAVTGPWRNGGR